MNGEKVLAELSVSEALCFGEILLGKAALSQQAVEEALTFLFSNCLRVSRAEFFLKLEEVIKHHRMDRNTGNDGQLELFKFQQSEGQKKNIEKELKIARAQAYLNLLRSNELKYLTEMPLQGNEKYRSVTSGFCECLREERKIEGDQNPKDFSPVEYDEILSYLLEFLPENDAMEVERKCRQNTDWQIEKIWTSQVIGWMEDAVRKLEHFSIVPEPSFESAREQRILKMITSENDQEPNSTNSSGEISEETNSIDAPPKKQGLIKDKNIRIWASVGVLACLVGYFGWKERIDEIEEASLRVTNDSPEIAAQSNDSVLDDNWSQVAMLAAQNSADRVLGEKLVRQIEKMEKEISIPANLLHTPVKTQAQESLMNYEITEDILPNKALIRKLNKVLSASDGHLFLPGDESLGRVVELNRTGVCDFYFTRADWPNPEKSFGLAVADYELRMGSEKDGFVIMLGGVKRADLTTQENDRSRPRYHLASHSAWYLDENQSRLSIDLSELGKLSP
jgi:hypothetical protein